MPRESIESRLGEADEGRFGLGSESDDVLDLVGFVRSCGNDEESGEEIGRNAVSGGNTVVVGAPDRTSASVRGENHDGRQTGFESSVEIGEAFNVEHVDLVR